MLFDAEFGGRTRKLLAQASRNGYFFLLDRSGRAFADGAFCDRPIGPKGLDAHGQPIPNPAKEPQLDGSLVAAGEEGATNWMAPSFDPETKLFYVNAQRVSWCTTWISMQEKSEGHQGGSATSLWSKAPLVAIDYQTGRIRWSRREEEGEGHPGILTTAGHLLFTGDVSGNLLGLDPETAIRLARECGGNLGSSPMTYELDGRQYVMTGVDSVLYAWALPGASRNLH